MAASLYDVLGISKSASDAEIGAAFKKLAKKNHPDLNPGDKAAENRFKKASAAYEILGDKAKRARYDRGEIDADGRERGFNGFGNGGFGAGQRRGPGQTGEWSFGNGQGGGFAFDDILSDLFGGAKKRSSRGASGGPEFGSSGMPPEDIKLALEISLLEAARGCKKRVRLPDESTVDLSIPSGVEEGRILRLRGKGASAGDALVEIKVQTDPVFSRSGLELHMDQAVPLETAVLGGKVRTATPDGAIMLSVPPGSSSGKRLRLKDKGIHDQATGRKGDLLVRLMIELPAKPDPELEKAVRGWAESKNTVS